MKEFIFKIGTLKANYLRLIFERRTYPEAKDFWDGNWLSARAEAVSNGFRAKLDLSVRTDEVHPNSEKA